MMHTASSDMKLGRGCQSISGGAGTGARSRARRPSEISSREASRRQSVGRAAKTVLAAKQPRDAFEMILRRSFDFGRSARPHHCRRRQHGGDARRAMMCLMSAARSLIHATPIVATPLAADFMPHADVMLHRRAKQPKRMHCHDICTDLSVTI